MSSAPASTSERWAWEEKPRAIAAVQADNGSVLWRESSPVAPMTLTVDAARVYFHDGTHVVALNRGSGRRLWASKPVPRAEKIRSWFAPTLVAQDDVLVFAGGEKIERHKGGKDTMTALSAETGKILWTAEHPPSGYDSPEDVFIIDGLVWTAPTTNKRDTGTVTGRDLHTGEVKRTFPAADGVHMPHHRCHRAKATDRYLVMSRTGIEYVDLAAEHWNRNDWVRGACLYGLVPANGLTYAPPHSCACYIVAKLNGLNALAASRPGAGDEARGTGEGPRLVRDAAYGAVSSQPSAVSPGDWPTYRHDAARSGSTGGEVTAKLGLAWETTLGGRLSSLVIAEGKVFVASVEEHTVQALDEATGKKLWSYTTGGRVDSPPTVWRGRVLFGSADGHVYCLRADDGAPVWRFRAAPADRRVVAWEQVESAWPVHGSVLVHEGVVHCLAGRSMFLDGGMRYVRLDAASGELLSETVLDNVNPKTGKPLDAEVKWPNLPVALPDVLSYDDKYVYMRSQRFDLQGKRIDVAPPTDFKDQTGDGAHLFCPTGFLDDSWWHRTYWVYGKSPVGGAGGWYLSAYQAPAGRIMVCDDERVYAFGRRPQYFPRTTALEYHIFAANKQPDIVGLDGQPLGSPTKMIGGRRRPAPSHATYNWTREAPLLGRALVLAGDTLFVAGPPDVTDQEETLTSLDEAATQASLAEQRDAYAGKKGGVLLAVSKTNGDRLAAYRLKSMPVFDGMAAANGRLFLSATDGKVLCLAGEGEPLTDAPDVEVEETPPFTAGGVRLTAKHPDFDLLSQVKIDPCDLGWRIRTPPGKTGLAFQKLDKPLTRKATLRLRLLMIPNVSRDPKRPPPGNAFLAFGDEPDDEHTLKCGLRNAGQASQITEGPLMAGKTVSGRIKSDTEKVIHCTVTVDLEAQTVTLDLLGTTTTKKLERKLKQIAYLGFAVNSVASEFSEVEVNGS